MRGEPRKGKGSRTHLDEEAYVGEQILAETAKRLTAATRATDPDGAAITRGIIGLGKSLRLRVVVAGVEHDAQLEYLMRYGGEEAQGCLLSEPIPPQVLQERF